MGRQATGDVLNGIELVSSPDDSRGCNDWNEKGPPASMVVFPLHHP
jgi:hypothetical protein